MLHARVARRDARPRHQQWHAHRRLEVDDLSPQAVMAGHLAVVAGVDDDGVVEQSGGIQPAHQLTDEVVDEVDAGVVRLTRAELLLGGQILAYLLGETAARVVVEPVREVGRQLHRRHAVAIAPDVAAGGGERRVRAAVGGAQEPRGLRLGVLMLQEKRQRLARDHVLLQQALRDLRDARSRRPGVDGEEVDGVDLMAQPVAQVAVRAVLEPLHLVGAAEVHLADQAGPVAVRGEVAGPRDVLGKDHPVVVPGSAAVRVLGGHQAHARRRAHRAGAQRRVELHRIGGDRVQRLGAHDRVSGEAGYERRVLVGKQQQDVRSSCRLGCHRFSSAPGQAGPKYWLNFAA